MLFRYCIQSIDGKHMILRKISLLSNMQKVIKTQRDHGNEYCRGFVFIDYPSQEEHSKMFLAND